MKVFLPDNHFIIRKKIKLQEPAAALQQATGT